jgi:hypothetical protein
MHIGLKTYCTSLLLMTFAIFGLGSSATAQDAAWHVSKSSGEVWVTNSGVQKASVTAATVLQPGDNIRTGQTGRVLLVRGKESMLISPNSIIGIPKESSDGMATTIIQRAGTILLDVEKRSVKHFEVETPYLAAVVKGTRFRVTVGKDDAHVDVLRGHVEVSDYKSGQYALIAAGQTAKVSTQGPFGLSLSGSGTLSSIQQGTPRSSSSRPTPATDEDFSAPAKPAQQIEASSPRGDIKSIVASSESNSAVNAKLWTPDSAANGEDDGSADGRWPRNKEIIAALSLPFGVGLFVAVAVTTYRQRRKNKNNDKRPADY